MHTVMSTSQHKYICVLDFEATCDDDKRFNPRNEVIEFPSVLLKYNPETENYDYHDEIQLFCKPLFNTELTPFCKKLTGITQEQVDKGVDFTDALNTHHKWLMDKTKMHEDDNNTVVVVTCCCCHLWLVGHVHYDAGRV